MQDRSRPASHGPNQPLRSGTGPIRIIRHRGGSFVVDVPDAIGISICLGESFATEMRVDGRVHAQMPRLGDFAVLAPGHPAHVAIRGDCRAVQVWLPTSLMGRLMAEDHDLDAARLDPRPSVHRADLQLLALVLAGASQPGIAMEEWARPIVALLCQRYAPAIGARAVTRRSSSRGGLAPGRLRRALDYIEQHLAGPLPLRALAAEAGLSPYHFAREFAATMGQPPHSYIIERRLARAVTLLGWRGLAADEAAQRAGFAHGSHLARHLRARLGQPPQTIRDLGLL